MDMQALGLAGSAEHHESDTRRAMERIFRWVAKPSFDHADIAGAEDALRFDENARFLILADFLGEERAPEHRAAASADEVEILREMAEMAVALSRQAEITKDLVVEPVVLS